MERTNELNNVLAYIENTLILEAPTTEITIEYLLASILDSRKCHAHFIIEECLMSSNVEGLRKIYDDFVITFNYNACDIAGQMVSVYGGDMGLMLLYQYQYGNELLVRRRSKSFRQQ